MYNSRSIHEQNLSNWIEQPKTVTDLEQTTLEFELITWYDLDFLSTAFAFSFFIWPFKNCFNILPVGSSEHALFELVVIQSHDRKSSGRVLITDIEYVWSWPILLGTDVSPHGHFATTSSAPDFSLSAQSVTFERTKCEFRTPQVHILG
jgi:hypothetical protein